MYKVDDFGEAFFTRKKYGFEGGITVYGKIIAVSEKLVMFQDNDDIEYLINKDEFQFEVKEFKNLVNK